MAQPFVSPITAIHEKLFNASISYFGTESIYIQSFQRMAGSSHEIIWVALSGIKLSGDRL